MLITILHAICKKQKKKFYQQIVMRITYKFKFLYIRLNQIIGPFELTIIPRGDLYRLNLAYNLYKKQVKYL